MLRKEIKDRIQNILKRSPLTEHAFQLKFGNNENEVLVEIRYVLTSSFKFSAGIDSTRGGFWINRAPGDQLLSEEAFKTNEISGVVDHVAAWVQAVQIEDEVDPELDGEVSKLREAFFKELSKHVKDENRHFTREEADELTARVEKLEQQIEQIMAQQKKSESEVRSVKKMMQEAKKDAGTMTKRKWLVVGGGKIFNALISIATSREGRKAIVDSVKGYLEQKNP